MSWTLNEGFGNCILKRGWKFFWTEHHEQRVEEYLDSVHDE